MESFTGVLVLKSSVLDLLFNFIFNLGLFSSSFELSIYFSFWGADVEQIGQLSFFLYFL